MEKLMHINTTILARANKKELQEMHQELIVNKMRLDKFFSIFLEENELDHDDLDDPNWVIYKDRLSEYRTTSHLIKRAEYHMGKLHDTTKTV